MKTYNTVQEGVTEKERQKQRQTNIHGYFDIDILCPQSFADRDVLPAKRTKKKRKNKRKKKRRKEKIKEKK